MNKLAPFALGDLFVTGSTLDETARFPTGMGKVLQFSADWQPKGSFETGQRGLISAVVLDWHGYLHALDPQARTITTIGPDGREAPYFEHLPAAAYGSMIVLGGGEYLLGEHMVGENPGFFGQGKVYRIDRKGRIQATYDTETNGGMGGFLGVTHMALSGDGKTLFHTSETGAHVYAHDLIADRRLGPVYTRQDPPPMVFGLAMLGDGRLAVACGNGLRLVDPSTGTATLVDLPESRGWAVPISRQEGHLWVLDFFEGQVICIDVANGTVHEQHRLGLAKCLTGIAEVPA